MEIKPEISIVVPVYNSEAILPELIKRIKESFQKASITYELILVNDFSTDKSWDVIIKLMSENPFIKAFQNKKNFGQLTTVLIGISKSKGKYISTIDDDLEYNPEDIINLYETIVSKDLDVVFGIAIDKYKIKGKSRFISTFRNRIINFLLRKPKTDSFKIFKRTFVFEDDNLLLTIPFESYLSQKNDFVKVSYLNVSYNKRFSGKSNYTLTKKIKMFFQLIAHSK